MVYLIAFEAQDSLYDHYGLIEEIKSIGSSYQHPMEAVWFVSVDKTVYPTSTDIYNRLQHKFGGKVRLFITEIDPGISRQGWMPKIFWTWLKLEFNK